MYTISKSAQKLLVLLLSGTTVLISCKKQQPSSVPTDTTAPVITLLGATNDTVLLGNTYTDPGATATDNRDGDISPFIVVSGIVNTTLTGNYTKEYNVRDGSGNVAQKKTRNIRVKNSADYLAGTYTAACSCATLITGVVQQTVDLTYTTQVLVSPVANNAATITAYSDQLTPLKINVNNNLISVQMFGSGSGTVNASGNTFTLSTVGYDQGYPSRSYECTAIHHR